MKYVFPLLHFGFSHMTCCGQQNEEEKLMCQGPQDLACLPLALLDGPLPSRWEVLAHTSSLVSRGQTHGAEPSLPPNPAQICRYKSCHCQSLSLGALCFAAIANGYTCYQQTELDIIRVTVIKKSCFCGHEGGNTEGWLQMPSLKKSLQVLLRTQKGLLEYLTLYDLIWWGENLFLVFPGWVFAFVLPVSTLTFCCPPLPTIFSISASQVQSVHPQMAFLKVPPLIFSYSATEDFQLQFSEADQVFIIHGNLLFMKQSLEYRCHFLNIK